MDRSEKVRENRLRRMAKRQNLLVCKSRRRDPMALDYGLYHIVDLYTNGIVTGAGPFDYMMTLDEVETFLRPIGRADE